MEATESPDIALKYYAELLEADPTNAVCDYDNRVLFSQTFISLKGHMEAPYLDIQTDKQDR